jgi:hypothetical protein
MSIDRNPHFFHYQFILFLFIVLFIQAKKNRSHRYMYSDIRRTAAQYANKTNENSKNSRTSLQKHNERLSFDLKEQTK